MYELELKCPFALPHHRLVCAVLGYAVNIHLWRADHEVHMVETDVPAGGDKFLVVQFLSTRKGEAVGASNGDVAGCVLVE